MPTPFLPYQRDPIAGNATTTDAWYQFFIGLRQFLVSSGLDTGIIDQILARLDELEQNQVGAFVIQGLLSVDVFGTPEDGFVQIQLVGDVESPGTNYYYGTDDTGVKGWFNSASNLKIASLTGSTYSTVQDFVNTMHSPGVITGGEVTDIGSGNVRILAGTGMIRIADDDVSSLPFFNFAQTDFAVPNDQLTRFFGVVYNAGSPVVEMRTSDNWNKDTEIPLGSAVRLSATITNVTPNKYRIGDPITNVIQRFDAQSPAIRDNSIGGLLIGESGVRNVTVTAGKIWSRLSDFDSAAKNSSVDTMLSVYFNGVNLTVTSGITQWDNLNFNTGGALVVMGNNKWANLWFFMSIDGTKYGFAYGTGEHNSLGAAANEGLPFYLNQNFFNQTLLLGRFVFQKGAATAGLIETAFASVFNTSAVNNHNDLAGLQGGAVGEYYHLTAAQNADVVTLSAGGTTGQFWRGDQVYSNALLGPFSARSLIDAATFGADQVVNGTFTGGLASWTAGAGWAGAANTAQFTVGGAGTLSQNVTVTSGRAYLLTWSQQHSIANNATILPSLGSVNGMPVSFGVTTNQATSRILIANATGSVALAFTPATLDGGGTVRLDNVTLSEITNVGNVVTLENVAGTVTTEARTYTSNTNTSYGRDAGRSVTTGTANSFFGAIAGRSVTTGNLNTFFGNAAGGSTTSGMQNAAFGGSALNANQTGNLNMAFGLNAMFSNVTGSENVGIGSSALRQNISGSGNVGVGRDAGRFLADGVTALTSPENCIYIGNDSRGLNDSDSDTIVIGNGAISRGANTAQWGNTSVLNHYFSGNVNVNTSSVVHGGAGVVGLGNATTVPTANPVGGIVEYAQAGSGKVRTPSGNIVTYAPDTAPTITGSRGGNAALASLLTALAAAGIIVDGTTP